MCTQAHRLADTFEKRVEELHKQVQEGMETGKLGIKEASHLVVELQDVSGCVCAATNLYIRTCVCVTLCMEDTYIHTYILYISVCTYIRTYSPYVSHNLFMIQLKDFASCCQNEGGDFVNVHCVKESL